MATVHDHGQNSEPLARQFADVESAGSAGSDGVVSTSFPRYRSALSSLYTG